MRMEIRILVFKYVKSILYIDKKKGCFFNILQPCSMRVITYLTSNKYALKYSLLFALYSLCNILCPSPCTAIIKAKYIQLYSTKMFCRANIILIEEFESFVALDSGFFFRNFFSK